MRSKFTKTKLFIIILMTLLALSIAYLSGKKAPAIKEVYKEIHHHKKHEHHK